VILAFDLPQYDWESHQDVVSTEFRVEHRCARRTIYVIEIVFRTPLPLSVSEWK
jgi:hypothetical protein